MPLDLARPSAPIRQASVVDLAALGRYAALAAWPGESGPESRRGFRAVLDGRPVPPPAAHCSIARGDRQLHLLALPLDVGALAAAPLDVLGLDGAIVAAASPARSGAPRASDLDLIALLDELHPAERIRLCRFVLEVCPPLLKLGRDSVFTALADDVVRALSRRPGRLQPHSVAGPLAIYEAAARRGLGSTLSAVAVSRHGVARCLIAPRELAQTTVADGVARVAVALDRDIAAAGGTLVILGEGGIACRLLPPETPAETAFARASSDKGLEAPMRDYIIDALAAADTTAQPTLTAIAELRAVATARAVPMTAGPIAARLDCVVANAGGVAVIGVLDDPHDLVDALVVTRRSRATVVDLQTTLRRIEPSDSRTQPSLRFVLTLPPTSDAALPASVAIEARLRSGQRIALGSGPTVPSAADEARAIVEAAMATGIATGRLAATLAPVVRAAAAAAVVDAGIDVEPIGEPGSPTRRSAIVTPLGTDPTLLRARFAGFALDHTLDDADIVFVAEDPACAEDGRTVLAGLAGLYDRGARLVTPRRPLAAATALTRAIQALDVDFVALLDAGAVPAQPAWLDAMLGALAARPRAGLIAAQMLHPDGSLVDAGFAPASDGRTRGPIARLAGFPAAFPGHEAAQRASAVRRGAWLLRRSLFALVDGFDAARLTPLGVDLAFARRLARAGFETWTLGEPRFVIHTVAAVDRAGALREAIDRADFDLVVDAAVDAAPAAEAPAAVELPPAIADRSDAATPDGDAMLNSSERAARKKRSRKSRRAA